jgi:hypothetical protein
MVAGLMAGLGVLAGCAPKPPPPQPVAIAPDPFGYIKKSAVCTIGPFKPAATGGRVVTMAVRSDDGECQVPVAQDTRTAYASFGLQTAPTHGKAFIYNYNNQTLVTYTPTTAYAGPDSFTVNLIPGGGKPRTTLQVLATVDATGVTPPAPPVTPKVSGPPATSSKSSKSSSKSSKTRRKTH